MEKREAKVVENTKTAIFIRGGHTSEVVTEALKDLVGISLLSLEVLILLAN